MLNNKTKHVYITKKHSLATDWKVNMDTYTIITNRIIAQLEKDIAPWRKEWSGRTPTNLVSKKPYKGINLILLSMNEFTSNYWLTFKQAQQLGGKIKKGSTGTPVIFWKTDNYAVTVPNDSTEENAPKTKIVLKPGFLLRYYTVFNLDQCEGIKNPQVTGQEFTPINKANIIIDNYATKPQIVHNDGDRAFYSPARDILTMPSKNNFISPEAYYSTLFHELTHSTGHEKRLNRWKKEEVLSFGNESYSKEELIAELGSAFLCADSGISNKTIENQTAYIRGWLKALKNDKKLIIHASAKATRAVNYMENRIIDNFTNGKDAN